MAGINTKYRALIDLHAIGNERVSGRHKTTLRIHSLGIQTLYRLICVLLGQTLLADLHY